MTNVLMTLGFGILSLLIFSFGLRHQFRHWLLQRYSEYTADSIFMAFYFFLILSAAGFGIALIWSRDPSVAPLFWQDTPRREQLKPSLATVQSQQAKPTVVSADWQLACQHSLCVVCSRDDVGHITCHKFYPNSRPELTPVD